MLLKVDRNDNTHHIIVWTGENSLKRIKMKTKIEISQARVFVACT